MILQKTIDKYGRPVGEGQEQTDRQDYLLRLIHQEGKGWWWAIRCVEDGAEYTLYESQEVFPDEHTACNGLYGQVARLYPVGKAFHTKIYDPETGTETPFLDVDSLGHCKALVLKDLKIGQRLLVFKEYENSPDPFDPDWVFVARYEKTGEWECTRIYEGGIRKVEV